jgi:hypothetical protein
VRYVKFSGVLEEIIERYPNLDIADFLAQKLQIPPDKAEALAARIEKQCLQEAPNKTEQTRPRKMLEKPIKPEHIPWAGTYAVGCLSQKEFVSFTGWLFSELGYKLQPERYESEWGVDFVAVEGDVKIAVVARRYPAQHEVSEAVGLVAQQAKHAHHCERCIVISTANFTQNVQARAQQEGIELWDPNTLDIKICEVQRNANRKEPYSFPPYQTSLLQSLLKLGKTKDFLVEPKSAEKYDLYLSGVRHPLLTFQGSSDVVTACVFRIKYNEPVSESEGEALITSKGDGTTAGPDDETAYGLIVKYLENFLE